MGGEHVACVMLGCLDRSVWLQKPDYESGRSESDGGLADQGEIDLVSYIKIAPCILGVKSVHVCTFFNSHRRDGWYAESGS